MKNNPGLYIDHALIYAIDNYSTPDNWYNLGFELQYDFAAYFENNIPNSERETFIAALINTFLSAFKLPEDHLRYFRWVDDALVNFLYKALGISPEEEAEKQPFKFVILLFHNKGPFDLRILKQLEDEIDHIASAKCIRLEITKFIIIPRSKEAIAKKVSNFDGHKN